MPIRLMVVLVSCLLPAVAECAAPFVESRQGQAAFEMLETARKAVASVGPEVDLGLMRPMEWKEKVQRSEPQTRAIPKVKEWWKDHMRGWVGTAYDGGWQGRDSVMLPMIDDVSHPFLLASSNKIPARSPGKNGGFVGYSEPPVAELELLHPPETPSLSLNSRRLNLHLDTAGIGRLGSATVELWLTRDGYTWRCYQREVLSDSLRVMLPWEGRYGLRVVVQDVDGPASPTPRSGEAPQLWIEVDESKLVWSKKRRVVDGERYIYEEMALQRKSKQAKEDRRYPRCEIERVEAEVEVDKVEPREVELRKPGYENFSMPGWTR